ncbi:MAG: hypothetical protein WC405_18495 [Syntrophales bacterium]
MAKVTILIEDTEGPGLAMRYKPGRRLKKVSPAQQIGDQLMKDLKNNRLLARLCKKAGVI